MPDDDIDRTTAPATLIAQHEWHQTMSIPLQATDILLELAAQDEQFPGEHDPCSCYPAFDHGFDAACWYHRAWNVLTCTMHAVEADRFRVELHNWRDHAGPKPRII